LAELWDRALANAVDAAPVVDAADRNPNILNGGLDKVSPWYWAVILGAAAVIDIYQINRANSEDPAYFPGNLNFDPLGLYPKDKKGQLEMQAKEIRNGRLAMIAVTGFVAQEFVQGNGIVDHSSFFFKPFFL
jgi:Chlorophyll A-B binding protein